MDPSASYHIFTGSDGVLPLRLAYPSGLPVDLTLCTEIVVNLQKNDGTYLQLKLTLTQVAIVSPVTTGQFNTTITASQSAALMIGEAQDVDVTFTINAKVSTVRFYGVLSVFEAA